jgi:hypothetical protein
MGRHLNTLWAASIVAGIAVLLVSGCTPKTQSASARSDAESRAQAAEPSEPAPQAADPQPSPQPDDDATADTKITAYYFHRTMRCTTCLSIENQAREAVKAGFPQEFAGGRLKWQAVDIEQPGNEHFEKDFELEASSLVIVEQRDDDITRWKNLTRVWELHEDGDAYRKYVQTEVAAYLHP